MSSPIDNIFVYGGTEFYCENCGEIIKNGDKFAEIKWKKYRKKGVILVCESCAEGIIKEWEDR